MFLAGKYLEIFLWGKNGSPHQHKYNILQNGHNIQISKNINDKDSDSKKGLDKGVVVPTNNKFLKAAKTAALISKLKQGRDICTCSSLDAKCYIHDS